MPAYSRRVLKLVLFVLPLGLDTFAVAAALGVQGAPAKERLKESLLMSSFEMAMPVLGLLLGHGLGVAIGGVANYIAAAALLALGGWMLVADEGDEGEKVSALSSRDALRRSDSGSASASTNWRWASRSASSISRSFSPSQ
jgi:putative Mn2+ efflux pump MntP